MNFNPLTIGLMGAYTAHEIKPAPKDRLRHLGLIVLHAAFAEAALTYYVEAAQAACPGATVEVKPTNGNGEPVADGSPETRNVMLFIGRDGNDVRLALRYAMRDVLLNDHERPEDGVRAHWAEMFDELQERILEAVLEGPDALNDLGRELAPAYGPRFLAALRGPGGMPLRYRAELANLMLQKADLGEAEFNRRVAALQAQEPTMGMRSAETRIKPGDPVDFAQARQQATDALNRQPFLRHGEKPPRRGTN